MFEFGPNVEFDPTVDVDRVDEDRVDEDRVDEGDNPQSGLMLASDPVSPLSVVQSSSSPKPNPWNWRNGGHGHVWDDEDGVEEMIGGGVMGSSSEVLGDGVRPFGVSSD